MGKISVAAKITHVPSMFISEQPGPNQGCRQAAIDGLGEIGRRCDAAGVDTIVVFDTHWLVNTAFHINSRARYAGVYTSNEFPHFIQDLKYDYRGAPELGDAVAAIATEKGVRVMSHHVDTLDLEYGTLVPMRYINADGRFRVLSIAAWCPWHEMEDSMKIGQAVREAIEASNLNAAVLASGSLSHRIHDNNDAPAGIHTISDEFYRQVDLRVVDLWKDGRNKEFLDMLPLYSTLCHGEGFMHDTAMLFGALGWDRYAGRAEILTDYFTSSGTGQINAVFPLAA
ncbi:3,4-dihydroxyphenylacetate 2,3-dioxygenase [Rhizobium sp. KVB221]|uniref:3,4-dihydroxyphenylacetate 2,3-dioxygenase n=1 Tax=Rhizobium setariae TaxID=2801340 RepID=A0A936YIC3_9HYPH|nr:3,4-dihydroxyphenylacetate 2,3-dioxygenase [Rhizobium setariae]MBL0370799.1 3,4-dihydroxyphenylacetate 2,3-dioxygenase [Rhizobium setariae]